MDKKFADLQKGDIIYNYYENYNYIGNKIILRYVVVDIDKQNNKIKLYNNYNYNFIAMFNNKNYCYDKDYNYGNTFPILINNGFIDWYNIDDFNTSNIIAKRKNYALGIDVGDQLYIDHAINVDNIGSHNLFDNNSNTYIDFFNYVILSFLWMTPYCELKDNIEEMKNNEFVFFNVYDINLSKKNIEELMNKFMEQFAGLGGEAMIDDFFHFLTYNNDKKK